MTNAATASTSAVQVVSLPAVLSIDLLDFSMQSLIDSVRNSYNTSTYAVLGIDIPVVGVDCLIYKTVSPAFDISESLVRLFDYLGKLALKPVWTVLEQLAQALGVAVDGLLEIPVLGLKIPDLFKEDLWQTVENIVRSLWDQGQEQLELILKQLDIPWPPFEDIDDTDLSIRTVSKNIAVNLLQFVWKAVDKIIKLIETALRVFDFANYQKPVWSEVWKKAVDAVLGAFLDFFVAPFTPGKLEKLIKDFARDTLGISDITFPDIMSIIEKFKLVLFGYPLDYELPVDPKMEFPERDFKKIIPDMLAWFNNFLINLLKKFVEAAISVLQFFGINFEFLTKFEVPITLCAVENQSS